MSSESHLPSPHRLPLAHQQDFIDSFLTSPPGAHLLISDVGLGATTAASLVIERFAVAEAGSRVLILAPSSALQAHIVDTMSRAGLAAQLVDRYKYREMQYRGHHAEATWPEGGIFVLTADFAKQADIAGSLVTVPWGLLVLHEAHSFKGARERLVSHIVASSPAIRLLALTPIWERSVSSFGLGAYKETRWTAPAILRAEGVSSPQRQLVIQILKFQRDNGTPELNAELEMIARLLAQRNLIRDQLDRSLLSSPAALEVMLQRLRNRVTHGTFTILPSEDDQSDELISVEPIELISETDKEELVHALDRCLNELEKSTRDSKLSALLEELQSPLGDSNRPARVAVFAEYRPTLFYLQTQLEEAGHATYLLHGAVAPSKRTEVVDNFVENGGILLAAQAIIMEGIELPSADLLVLYDHPSSARMLHQLVGRFNRFDKGSLRKLCLMQGSEEVLGDLVEGLLALEES